MMIDRAEHSLFARRCTMNTNMSYPQGCDIVLSMDQIFATPLLSTKPIRFWLELVVERSEANIGYHTIVSDDMKSIFFLMTSSPSKINAIWKSISELESVFNDLKRHDILAHFSDSIGKPLSH